MGCKIVATYYIYFNAWFFRYLNSSTLFKRNISWQFHRFIIYFFKCCLNFCHIMKIFPGDFRKYYHTLLYGYVMSYVVNINIIVLIIKSLSRNFKLKKKTFNRYIKSSFLDSSIILSFVLKAQRFMQFWNFGYVF